MRRMVALSGRLSVSIDCGQIRTYLWSFSCWRSCVVFLGAKEISKTDFFSFFQTFSDKTFTPKLRKSAFKKAGLIPWNPSIVLDKMKSYGGIQQAPDPPSSTSSRESTPGFATPPPAPWSEFQTPITYTQRKRGADYIDGRVKNGPWPLTPTALHVMDKIEKGTQKLILSGQLSTELLQANAAAGEARQKRKDAKGTVMQKYGEIYGGQARRQMRADDDDEAKVVNMRLKREQKPWKAKWKALSRGWTDQYNELLYQGKFCLCQPAWGDEIHHIK
ncbi:hypothetical protein B0J14DRAFT_676966 [Halenospora varia]|nr:hypothetical protein B0J14DRAFT_676966 [Halenospora varia]